MERINQVLLNMIDLYAGDPRRINHFLKVHSFAKIIGSGEGINPDQLEVLEMAAALHDIGIHTSEEKYGSSSGKYQEIEGPALAKDLLKEFNISESVVDRVCYLVGNHHTYGKIDGIDFQILVEADFLVNIYEDEMKKETVKTVKDKYFRTETGTRILEEMFL